jgi:hypothetical protein
MEFILGALVGAGALTVAIAVSMAKAAKEADEIENELLRGGIEHEEE